MYDKREDIFFGICMMKLYRFTESRIICLLWINGHHRVVKGGQRVKGSEIRWEMKKTKQTQKSFYNERRNILFR